MPMVRIPSTLQKCGLCGEPCWSAGSACSKAQVRRVPFRKRRSLFPVQRESVNSSRPEFLPMVLPVRASDRDQGPQSRIAKLHFASAGLLFNSSFVPSPTTFITYWWPPHRSGTCSANTLPIQKLLHTGYMLCIGYYEARQRKNRANSWNDCHSPASAEKNMLGFRARASGIVDLAFKYTNKPTAG
jgi:hypothetical protein